MRRPSAFRPEARAATLALLLALGACAADQGAHRHGGPGHGPRGHSGPQPPRERVFLSPMGEPFRAAVDAGDPERAWFDGADADRDGRVTLAEFQADAARFFTTLDVGHDGEIDPADIDRYENIVAPEVRSGGGSGGARGGARSGGGGGGGGHGRGGGGRGGGGGMGGGGHGGGQNGGGDSSSSAPQATEPSRLGAGTYSYLDIPEPVVAADANMNRGIDDNEFANAAAARFKLLDTNGDGVLTWDELPHVHARGGGMRRPGGGGGRPGGGGFGGGSGQPGGFGGRPPQNQ